MFCKCQLVYVRWWICRGVKTDGWYITRKLQLQRIRKGSRKKKKKKKGAAKITCRTSHREDGWTKCSPRKAPFEPSWPFAPPPSSDVSPSFAPRGNPSPPVASRPGGNPTGSCVSAEADLRKKKEEEKQLTKKKD